MTTRNDDFNIEGVNGTGKGVVNTNSKDFKGLRQSIKEHAKKQTDLVTKNIDSKIY